MAPRTIARGWPCVFAATALVAGLGLTHAAASPAAPFDPVRPGDPARAVLPVRVSPASVITTPSAHPSMSADGRLIVFSGPPPQESPERSTTVFAHDVATNGTIELTVPPAEARPGNSVMPAISADGCHVAIVTEVSFDLFRDDDTGSRWDVYQLTLPQCGGRPGDWELVSTQAGDTFQSNAGDDADPSFAPVLSGSGAVIAYTRRFSPGTPDLTGVAVVDLTVPVGEAGRITPVGGTPAAPPATTFRHRGLRQPSISDDGRYVAYTSDAASSAADRPWGSGPVPGEFATSQVYVWDRSNPDPATNVIAASSPPAAPANGAGGAPAISGDGARVAFESTATNLVPGAVLPACAAACSPQVYRYDIATSTTVLVSRQAGPPEGTPIAAETGASSPAIDFDGANVAFVTRAGNLFDVRAASGTGAASDGDIVLARPDTGTIERVSMLADGVTPAPASQSSPVISADGRFVTFDSDAGSSFALSELPVGRHVVQVARLPKLSMADLDVGTVAVGYPGGEWFVGMVNNGPTPFVPSAVTSSTPDFGLTGGALAGTPACEPGVAVAPGGTCVVTLILTPSVPGPIAGTLTIAEEGFGATGIQSQLLGSGGEPALSAPVAGANYESLVVGELSEAKSFEVANVGFAPANVVSVTVGGADPEDFVVTASVCSGWIDVRQSCTLDVAFAPKAAGQRSATITVETDLGQYTSLLVGGEGTYTPELMTSSPRFFTGSQVAIGGRGYPANTSVTVLWADGVGPRYTAVTNDRGEFLLYTSIGVAQRVGTRTLVAQTAGGQSATTNVLVVGATDHASSPASPTWQGA